MAKYRARLLADIDWSDSDFQSGARTYHYEGCRTQWGTNLGMGGEPLPLNANGGYRVQNTAGIFDYDGTVPTLRQKMGFHRTRIRMAEAIPPATEAVTVWDGYERMTSGAIQAGLREVGFEQLSLMARVADIRFRREFGVSTLAAVLRAWATAVGMEIDANAEIPAVATGPFEADFSALEFLQIIAPMANGWVYETYDGKIGVRSHAGALAATTRRVGSTRPILNITEDDYLIYSNMKYGFAPRSIVNQMDAHELVRVPDVSVVRHAIPMVVQTQNLQGLGILSQWNSRGRYMVSGSRARWEMVSLTVTNSEGTAIVYSPPGQTQEGVSTQNYPGTVSFLNPGGTAIGAGDAGTDIIVRMPSTMDFSTFLPTATLVVNATINGAIPDSFNATLHTTYEPNAMASPIARLSRTIFDQCVDTRPPWYDVSNSGHLQAEVNRLAEPKNVIDAWLPIDQETPDKSADVLDIRVGDVINFGAESRGLASTKCFVAHALLNDQCASVPRMEYKLHALG